MNRPYDDEDDDPPGRLRSKNTGNVDREISLGAPTILGIFFALVLLCGCFFGFGYSMGRKSAQAANVDASAANADTSSTGSAKPAAGSLANQPYVPSSTASQPATNDTAPAATQAEPTPAPTSTKNNVTPADGMIVGDKPPAHNQQPASSQPPAPAISPTGTIMVQVAAVSSQDVADILLASLKKKGYSVAIHHEPQDKLLHVQIGPFATHKDAEAMCQRVLADGFNAIVK